ncbi:hypothetical protein GGI42DRAFT_245166 [Trichoderma sp. SZMC 28013]
MPYVTQPEPDLVRMPEGELYAKLAGFREQMSAGPSWILSAIPILELDDSPEGEYFPHKWCSERVQVFVLRTTRSQRPQILDPRNRESAALMGSVYPFLNSLQDLPGRVVVRNKG